MKESVFEQIPDPILHDQSFPSLALASFMDDLNNDPKPLDRQTGILGIPSPRIMFSRGDMKTNIDDPSLWRSLSNIPAADKIPTFARTI